MKNTAIIIFFAAQLLCGCDENKFSEKAHLPSKKYHYVDIDLASLKKQQTVYVPVYSDIYHTSGENRFLLTATLSIRNTSLGETMYVGAAEYHDSEGKLIKKYLKSPVLISPLASIEFVVEDREQQGGAGANFVVTWGANAESVRPVIQAVMIGTVSQQGISFVADSVVIEEKRR